MSKTTSLPGGFTERSAKWHKRKFILFTKRKLEIGEPSPHLTIVGHMSKDVSIRKRLWLLGCYAATYCLPSAQVIWELSPKSIESGWAGCPDLDWFKKHWKGIITRTERRCVRTPEKMWECLMSYREWMYHEYPRLLKIGKKPGMANTPKFYDIVWESVSAIRYFGRYINIRLIEGLRRYCDIPASLYDIRSIGGWSPKKCLAYLYPQHAKVLLIDNKEGNALTNKLAYELLAEVQKTVPKCNEYIIAALLCEYKGAFEKRHQYTGWTIDQEIPLYDKAIAYWKDKVNTKPLWEAREALFPQEVLGEKNKWHGTRWELAKALRDHGYIWSDLLHDYEATLKTRNFAKPVLRDDKSPNRAVQNWS